MTCRRTVVVGQCAVGVMTLHVVARSESLTCLHSGAAVNQRSVVISFLHRIPRHMLCRIDLLCILNNKGHFI